MRIAAPPERVYELVADITQMDRWSPVSTGGRWLDGATEAVEGARFKGSNKEGPARWTTTCRILDARKGESLSWQVQLTGVRWGYRFEPDGSGGTEVTEWRDLSQRRALPFRVIEKLLRGKPAENTRKGMRETLERVKDAAEGPQ
jgi:uncharacterized protein YndB with AHSA1/START domain